MMRKWAAGILCAIAAAGILGAGAQASFEPELEAAYNTAVQGMDALDGLDVTVKEKTVSSFTNLEAEKSVSLKVSGIKGNGLKADIQVSTDEGRTESYYRDAYYYTTTSDGDIRREMDRSTIWEMINSHIYLDMTSNYLKMLSSQKNSDGTVLYRFAATEDTLGDYSKKLLFGSGNGQGLVIDALIGTMTTDEAGHIRERNIQMVYTVTQDEQSETFLVDTQAVFSQEGTVTVALPDLSGYKILSVEKPIETITPLMQTVYTTADVNVRAAGDLNAVILGGLTAGTGVTETGYTSDGWIQIQYNGAVGYISGDYVSTTRPVFTKNGSGTMYATADVNIRSSHDSGSSIIGVLAKGQSISITGTTSNGWVRIKYNGASGFVYGDYLSWSAPVADTYVKNGYVSGTITDASFGVLTIQRDDGRGKETFNTTYAELNLADTIYTGDWVEIYYYGAGAPYTASRVNNYTKHSASSQEESVSAEGVITSLTPDQMEVTCSDGLCRTFDISNADFEMADDLYDGKFVIVTWMSRTNGAETRNIEALRVKGE